MQICVLAYQNTMKRNLVLLIAFALSSTFIAQAQLNASSLLSRNTPQTSRVVTDTASICKAIRDSLRTRQLQILETYRYLVDKEGQVSDIRRLALRSDIFLYTDTHLPEVVKENAERAAEHYADSIRRVVNEGNFDQMMGVASKQLHARYDSLLRKKCGKAYERAGQFDPSAPELNKYQRKVVKQKNKLTPSLREELIAEMDIRLPNMQAEMRAERINDLRRDPIVYAAFSDVMLELDQQVKKWCALPDETLYNGYIDRVINPWFKEKFPNYTKRATGDLRAPNLQRQIYPAASHATNERIYFPSQVSRKAKYGDGKLALEIDIQTRLRKPSEVVSGRVSGTVTVRVVVEANGKLGKVSLLKKMGNAACNREALRVVKALPRTFQPALDAKGKPVRQYMDIPVRFAK